MSELNIDWGNTRAKWRLLGEGNTRDSGASQLDANEFVAELKKKFPSVSRIRVASVRCDETNQSLAAAMLESWGVTAEFAHTESAAAGVINSYSDPSRMGVDRWCGVVAARAFCQQAFCLVSCGSAVTLDFVDANGQHCGGYIVPGLHMQVAALTEGTGRVLVEERPAAASVSPADNTSEAVWNGVVAALVALIDSSVKQFRASSGPVKLLLVGGDAALLQPHLQFSSQLCDGLVLDGLALILP